MSQNPGQAMGQRAAYSRLQILAVICLGMTAGCINALQPILLGGLMEAGRLTTAQMGQAATAEALGMAISMTMAALFFKPRSLGLIALVAVVLSLFANSMTIFSDSALVIIAVRGVSGFGAGLLLWILVGLLARLSNPGRMFAIYVTGQALFIFLLSVLMTKLVLPAYGVTGSYAVLALMNALMFLPAMLAPRSYDNAGGEAPSASITLPPLQGLVALGGVGLYLSMIMAFWVYVLPIGTAVGHDPAVLNSTLPLAIAFQIAGGLAASFFAGRLSPVFVALLGAGTVTVVLMSYMAAQSSFQILLMLGIFAFFWMFVPPFHMPLLIEIDPSLRSAMFIGSAQLLGNAAGPMLASQFVAGNNAVPAAYVAIICAGLSCLLVITAHYMRKSPVAAMPA